MTVWNWFRRPSVRSEPLDDGVTAEIGDRPRTVRELLTEMKDTSELTLDLAWAAVAFDSPAFAEEVHALNLEMDRLLYEIRIAVMLAARDREGAEQLAGLLQVAGAAEDLAEAADVLCQLLDTDLSQRLDLPFMLREADESIRTVPVPSGSPIDRETLRELELENTTGCRVIAIMRGKRWMFGVAADARLLAEDVLMVRGTDDGFDALAGVLSPDAAPEVVASLQEIVPAHKAGPSEAATAQVNRPLDLFLAMKDASELMVDLAYSALLFDDRRVAEEIHYLDEEMEDLHYELQQMAVQGVAAACDPGMEDIEPVTVERALGLLRLAGAVERISEAARSIADVTLRDIDPHPVLAESMRESDSTVLRLKLVEPGSEDEDVAPGEGETDAAEAVLMAELAPEVAQRTLRDLRLATFTGMWVLGLRRGQRWNFGVQPKDQLAAGDVVLLRGPEEGLERLGALLGGADLSE